MGSGGGGGASNGSTERPFARSVPRGSCVCVCSANSHSCTLRGGKGPCFLLSVSLRMKRGYCTPEISSLLPTAKSLMWSWCPCKVSPRPPHSGKFQQSYRFTFTHTHTHTHTHTQRHVGFPGGSTVKNLPALQETQVWSLDQEYPLEKTRQPAPIFLPGESHGQKSLAGYSP